MGEIKSTLDLVMEKTRNLTLSDEEKKVQKQKETENRIKGLLQKLQDGLLTKRQLNQEYEILKKNAGLSDDKLLVNEILTRLDPDQDTQILLEVLEICCELDTAIFRDILDDYQKAYHQAAGDRAAQLKEILTQKHSIGGTAVIPNLDADDDWQQQSQEMQRAMEARLKQAGDQLITQPG